MVKAARSVVMVAFGWAVVTALPPLARWLRMRAM